MKYSSVLVDEFKPRTHRFFPRCLVLALVTGVIFYGFYAAVKVPVNELTSGQLEAGSPLCDCYSENFKPSDIDRQRLFYNRVPKCGSTTLITLIRKLAIFNNFKHVNSKVYDRKNVDEEEQRRIVKWVESFTSPCSFDRHVFFINFTRFGEKPPIYINIIRDPVERIISSFFYRRMVARQNKTKVKPSDYWLNKKFEHCVLTPDPECTFLEGQNYSVLQLPYFCGQEQQCQLLNDPYAIRKAKQNIEKYYAVVGTLEQMNMTLQVLQATLPRFFKGAYHVYHTLGVHRNQNLHKEYVKEEVKAILRANLTAEYELYNFVQQRLHQQFQQLSISKELNEELVEEEVDELLDY